MIPIKKKGRKAHKKREEKNKARKRKKAEEGIELICMYGGQMTHVYIDDIARQQHVIRSME